MSIVLPDLHGGEQMRKNLLLTLTSALMLSTIISTNVFAKSVYKEKFPGGVFIHDGDEPYLSELEIPGAGPRVLTGDNTDLIINTLENGIYDKWKGKAAQSITYCISDKFEDSKERVVEALKTATGDWMHAGNVKYIYMPQQDSTCDQNNKNVVFDVRPITGQPYLARAFFPNGPRLSRNILINSTSFKYDDVALTGFLRHELGHTLGFRHEHISKSSKGLCPENETFTPVTDYDQLSVMHYPQCGGKNVITNMVLSAMDEDGAKAVYPFKK